MSCKSSRRPSRRKSPPTETSTPFVASIGAHKVAICYRKPQTTTTYKRCHHHHQRLSVATFLKTTNTVLALALIGNLVHCQLNQLQSTPTTATASTTYQRSASASNIINNNINHLLVNHEPLQASLSLPIVRQPMLADSSDNVIESTTIMTNSLQSILSRPPSTHPQASLQFHHQAYNPMATTSCQLPPTWMGKWYQSNKEPIRVTNNEISDKGLCRDKKGDKYLFEYSKQQQQPCLVCLVINERHLNVLQYKESNCQPIPARFMNRTSNELLIDDEHTLLDSICSDITGDAQLESLFRLDTPAIECPINGKYHFTYDNCREPQSSLDSCIDKKQLNFRFSACPDLPGSESKSEVLKCYADWSEGNNYYMIGRLEHASNHQDKGKFRCFVYEKTADGGIQMAQSLEESCYGLINANDGPKTLRLSPRQPTNHKCHFPTFIQSQSENWLSVDNSLIYMFNQNSTKYQVKETREGNIIEEATCLQQFHHSTTASQATSLHPHASQQPHLHRNQNHHHQFTRSNSAGQQQVSPTTTQTTTSRRYPPSNFNQVDQSHLATRSIISDVVYLVQITKNCHPIDFCVRFHRRTNGIVQIDYFNAISGEGIQRCRNAYNATPQTQIITSTNLEHQRCPFEGVFTIEAPMETDLSYNPSNIFMCPRQSYLTAQCDHPSRLKIHYRCTPARVMVKTLHCLGSWSANGLVRLLLADDERQRYSAWYRDYGTLPANTDQGELANNAAQTLALQQQSSAINSFGGQTRSQQLLGSSATTASSSSNTNIQYNLLAPIVDLQIGLITPLPTISKPIQVRLTRRNQCSEVRGYPSQGTYGSPPMSSLSSSSMPSYAQSATSPAFSSASSIVILGKLNGNYADPSFLLTLIVTIAMIFQSRARIGNQIYVQ